MENLENIGPLPDMDPASLNLKIRRLEDELEETPSDFDLLEMEEEQRVLESEIKDLQKKLADAEEKAEAYDRIKDLVDPHPCIGPEGILEQIRALQAMTEPAMAC